MKKTYNSSEILCYETHPLNLVWNEKSERLAKDHFNPEEPRDEKGKWTNVKNFTSYNNNSTTKQKAFQTKPPEWEAVINTNMRIAYNKCILDKNSVPHSDWEDFGNFNYGAIGTACGFPKQMLLRAAGWAQKKVKA